MKNAVLLLRSAAFNVIVWITVLVFAPLSLCTFPLPQAARYRFITQWTRFNLWCLERICRVRFRVVGAEHLPKTPAIVVSNHQSAWETLAFQVIFPPQSWVLKRELLFIPLFGWALALTWPISIDRGARRRALQQILAGGMTRLNAGRWVVIFPEGTRRPPGALGRFGLGAALLAKHTGRPIVPVAHNAGCCWPKRGFIKRPGVITVVIGPPLPPEDAPEALTEQVRNWIERQGAAL
ncbi:MAG: lysophospholipid acyltransferase family protein [Acidiferrobacteraceae bacterium]